MFSFCPPSLPIENKQLQGLPDEWANILMFVWGHPVRWLCLGKAVHPTPEHVQTSMPQVDAIASRRLSGCSLGLFMMCLPFQTCVRVHKIMIALWACAMFASIDGAAGVPLWVSVKCSKNAFYCRHCATKARDQWRRVLWVSPTGHSGLRYWLWVKCLYCSPLLEMRTVCKKQRLPFTVCRNCRLPAISGCRCTGPESFHSPHGALGVNDCRSYRCFVSTGMACSWVICIMLSFGPPCLPFGPCAKFVPLAKNATTWRLALFHLRTHAKAELVILRSMGVCTCGFGSWNSPSTRWKKVGGECNLPFRKSRAAMIGLFCLMCRMRNVVFPMPQVLLSHVW